jgi:hypothetical protein
MGFVKTGAVVRKFYMRSRTKVRTYNVHFFLVSIEFGTGDLNKYLWIDSNNQNPRFKYPVAAKASNFVHFVHLCGRNVFALRPNMGNRYEEFWCVHVALLNVRTVCKTWKRLQKSCEIGRPIPFGLYKLKLRVCS